MPGLSVFSGARAFERSGKGVVFTHPNGAKVFIRGLGPSDAPDYGDHLLRLSMDDRHARFHGAISDNALRNHATGLDWNSTLLFGAYLDGVLRGAAELVELVDGRDGEIALSVESEFQHLALGKILMAALLVSASSLGLDHLRLPFLAGNGRMRDLARDYGATMSSSSVVVDAKIKTEAAAN